MDVMQKRPHELRRLQDGRMKDAFLTNVGQVASSQQDAASDG